MRKSVFEWIGVGKHHLFQCHQLYVVIVKISTLN